MVWLARLAGGAVLVGVALALVYGLAVLLVWTEDAWWDGRPLAAAVVAASTVLLFLAAGLSFWVSLRRLEQARQVEARRVEAETRLRHRAALMRVWNACRESKDDGVIQRAADRLARGIRSSDHPDDVVSLVDDVKEATRGFGSKLLQIVPDLPPEYGGRSLEMVVLTERLLAHLWGFAAALTEATRTDHYGERTIDLERARASFDSEDGQDIRWDELLSGQPFSELRSQISALESDAYQAVLVEGQSTR